MGERKSTKSHLTQNGVRRSLRATRAETYAALANIGEVSSHNARAASEDLAGTSLGDGASFCSSGKHLEECARTPPLWSESHHIVQPSSSRPPSNERRVEVNLKGRTIQVIVKLANIVLSSVPVAQGLVS